MSDRAQAYPVTPATAGPKIRHALGSVEPRTSPASSSASPQTASSTMPGELPETYVDGWHDPDVLKKMDYRTMPKFGKVSVISFGASGLGGMFTAGEGSGLTDASASGARGGGKLFWRARWLKPNA